jgi:hypothetical protein
MAGGYAHFIRGAVYASWWRPFVLADVRAHRTVARGWHILSEAKTSVALCIRLDIHQVIKKAKKVHWSTQYIDVVETIWLLRKALIKEGKGRPRTFGTA